MVAGSGNAKGLTEEKLHCSCQYMLMYNIGIFCLQETRASKADYYYNEDGFRIISAGTDEGKSWAGVGFIIAPWLAARVTNFLQFSDRLASLKVKTRRGKFGFTTAYAPHNLKPYDERRSFYSELITVQSKCRANGPRCVLGDLNARIGQQRTGEEDISGPYGFGKEASHKVESSNRELLLELCAEFKYVAANTFFVMPAEQKVAFAYAGSIPMRHVNEDSFHMLDLFFCPRRCIGYFF